MREIVMFRSKARFLNRSHFALPSADVAMEVDDGADEGGAFSDDEDGFSADEDGDEDEDTDDDASWKVRRAAAKTIEALILAYPEHLGDFYTTLAPAVIQRFIGELVSRVYFA